MLEAYPARGCGDGRRWPSVWPPVPGSLIGTFAWHASRYRRAHENPHPLLSSLFDPRARRSGQPLVGSVDSPSRASFSLAKGRAETRTRAFPGDRSRRDRAGGDPYRRASTAAPRGGEGGGARSVLQLGGARSGVQRSCRRGRGNSARTATLPGTWYNSLKLLLKSTGPTCSLALHSPRTARPPVRSPRSDIASGTLLWSWTTWCLAGCYWRRRRETVFAIDSKKRLHSRASFVPYQRDRVARTSGCRSSGNLLECTHTRLASRGASDGSSPAGSLAAFSCTPPLSVDLLLTSKSPACTPKPLPQSHAPIDLRSRFG